MTPVGEEQPLFSFSFPLDSIRCLFLLLVFGFQLSHTEAFFSFTQDALSQQIPTHEIYQSNGHLPFLLLLLLASSFVLPLPSIEMLSRTYLVYENYDQTNSCLTWNSSKSHLVESHGYALNYCFPGTGQLKGYHWQILHEPPVESPAESPEEQAIVLRYLFYKNDPSCQPQNEIAQSFETLTNGCFSRSPPGASQTGDHGAQEGDQEGLQGGQQGEEGQGQGKEEADFRSTRYSLHVGSVPIYRDGVIFYGYTNSSSCQEQSEMDRVTWSFVRNNGCDPQIFSPVTGLHQEDESRRCQRGERAGGGGGFIEILRYPSKGTVCQGKEEEGEVSVITVTNSCQKGSVTGGEEVFFHPSCI
jgi:hypothetical protein